MINKPYFSKVWLYFFLSGMIFYTLQHINFNYTLKGNTMEIVHFMDSTIYLIGPRGAGKTAVGKSTFLALNYRSIDRMIG